MKAQVGEFETRLGNRETRLYVRKWPYGDTTVHGVTIFPHLCGECVGGDHVHVDTLQEPVSLSSKDATLTEEQVSIVTDFLEAQLSLNEHAESLHAQLGKAST